VYTLTTTTIVHCMLGMFLGWIWAGAIERWRTALPSEAWRNPVGAVLLFVLAVLVELVSIVGGAALAIARWRGPVGWAWAPPSTGRPRWCSTNPRSSSIRLTTTALVRSIAAPGAMWT
jgi:hypothetical protein